MTGDLRSRILAQLAESGIQTRGPCCSEWCARLMLLRVVRVEVEAHELDREQPGGDCDPSYFCKGCADADWPCLALRRIAAGLGLEE